MEKAHFSGAVCAVPFAEGANFINDKRYKLLDQVHSCACAVM